MQRRRGGRGRASAPSPAPPRSHATSSSTERGVQPSARPTRVTSGGAERRRASSASSAKKSRSGPSKRAGRRAAGARARAYSATTHGLCVMTTIVRPARVQRARAARACAAARVVEPGRRLVEDQHLAARIASTDATASRWRSPLPSRNGSCVALASRPTAASASSTRARDLGRRRGRSSAARTPPRRRPSPRRADGRDSGTRSRPRARLARAAACARSAPSSRTLPAVGVQEPVQVLGERRLAGAVLADERDELAGADREADVVERRASACVGVPEPRTSSDRAARRRARRRRRAARRRRGTSPARAQRAAAAVDVERRLGSPRRARSTARSCGRTPARGAARRRRASSAAGGPSRDHAPVAQQDQPVGAPRRRRSRARRASSASRSPRTPASTAKTSRRPIGIEIGRRLVEQQHARLQREEARDREPLLLAARERRRIAARRSRRARRRERGARRAPRISAGGTPSCSRPNATSCVTLVEKSCASKSWNTIADAPGELADRRRRRSTRRRAGSRRARSPATKHGTMRVMQRSERRLAGAGRAHDDDELARRGTSSRHAASAGARGAGVACSVRSRTTTPSIAGASQEREPDGARDRGTATRARAPTCAGAAVVRAPPTARRQHRRPPISLPAANAPSVPATTQRDAERRARQRGDGGRGPSTSP